MYEEVVWSLTAYPCENLDEDPFIPYQLQQKERLPKMLRPSTPCFNRLCDYLLKTLETTLDSTPVGNLCSCYNIHKLINHKENPTELS